MTTINHFSLKAPHFRPFPPSLTLSTRTFPYYYYYYLHHGWCRIKGNLFLKLPPQLFRPKTFPKVLLHSFLMPAMDGLCTALSNMCSLLYLFPSQQGHDMFISFAILLDSLCCSSSPQNIISYCP